MELQQESVKHWDGLLKNMDLLQALPITMDLMEAPRIALIVRKPSIATMKANGITTGSRTLIDKTMKLKLPKAVLAMLKKRGGTIDAGLRATRAQLIKICEEHSYPPHISVIAFETAFGGLVIPDEGNKIKKNEPPWLFGTHACLTSGAHVTP